MFRLYILRHINRLIPACLTSVMDVRNTLSHQQSMISLTVDDSRACLKTVVLIWAFIYLEKEFVLTVYERLTKTVWDGNLTFWGHLPTISRRAVRKDFPKFRFWLAKNFIFPTCALTYELIKISTKHFTGVEIIDYLTIFSAFSLQYPSLIFFVLSSIFNGEVNRLSIEYEMITPN